MNRVQWLMMYFSFFLTVLALYNNKNEKKKKF